jgi:hypothetical protein
MRLPCWQANRPSPRSGETLTSRIVTGEAFRRHPTPLHHGCAGCVFAELIVGIPKHMDKLARLRHAQQRIVRAQRRVWLVQVLTWPALIATAVLWVGGVVWILRRRYAGGRHEMPDLPGAHEAGSVHVEPDGRLSHE